MILSNSDSHLNLLMECLALYRNLVPLGFVNVPCCGIIGYVMSLAVDSSSLALVFMTRRHKISLKCFHHYPYIHLYRVATY